MRALVITNKVRKIPSGFIETTVNPLLKNGYEVVWAANFKELKINKTDIPCSILETDSQSNPISIGSFKTYRKICNYLKTNKVDLIFCSTPIGGLIGRICGKKYKIQKVIYQAHGFLFFKGGPKLGFLYKMLEKYLAHYTDALITINKEDYHQALKFKLKNDSKNVFLVNGSGANYFGPQLTETEKEALRQKLKIDKCDFVFISIGELNKNKNVINTVKAFKQISIQNNCKLLVCGEGQQEKKIRNFIKKNNLANDVFLLGYRTDVKSLLSISNCYISTSYREGLSRTVGEALASGLPCVVSNKRGLSDWIEADYGFLVEPNCVKSIAKAMASVIVDKRPKYYAEYGMKKVDNYSSEVVSKQIDNILLIVLSKGNQQ